MKVRMWTSGGIVGSSTSEDYDLSAFVTDTSVFDGMSIEEVTAHIESKCQSDLFECAVEQASFEWGYRVIDDNEGEDVNG